MDVREKLVELLDDFPVQLEWHNNDELADHLIANGVTVQEWIPVTERLPENFVSVLGYMPASAPFPAVRECYTVGNAFFFPALNDVQMVTHWMPLPEPPKEGTV